MTISYFLIVIASLNVARRYILNTANDLFMSIAAATATPSSPRARRHPSPLIWGAISRLSCGLLPIHSTRSPQTSRVDEPVKPVNTSELRGIDITTVIAALASRKSESMDTLLTPAVPVDQLQEAGPQLISPETLSPPPILPVVAPGDPLPLLPPHPPLPPLPRPPQPALPPPTVCIVCQEGGVELPYDCQSCEASNICMPCLKEWFLDACKNESKMPPKCACSAIPLSAVINVLTVDEASFWGYAEKCPRLTNSRSDYIELSMTNTQRQTDYIVPYPPVQRLFPQDYMSLQNQRWVLRWSLKFHV
jgi:hypothetical protein